MSKRNTLPESLELLLDTMCNTFGGIMFVALALVIMSQFLVKTTENLAETQHSNVTTQHQQAQLELLEQELQLLKQQDDLVQHELDHDDFKAKQLAFHGKQLQQQLDEAVRRKNALQQVVNDATRNMETLQLQADALKARAESQDTNQKNNQDAEEIAGLLRRLDELQSQIKNAPQKKLRFTMDQNTTLKPYWVILKNNKVYRYGRDANPVKDEVAIKEDRLNNRGQFIPRKGHDLKTNSTQVLAEIFKDFTANSCYMHFVLDYESHDALRTLRTFCRNNNIQYNFWVNPDYTFVYASGVTYQAAP